jgi:hypothetical protein
LAFGLAVAVLCFVVEWQRSGHPHNFLDGHYYHENRREIDLIGRAVENWRRMHGSLPRSLDVLRDSDHGERGFSIRFNDERKVIDAWGKPVVYKIDGDEFELASYGEDGKPGGHWLNNDLSNREPFPLICIPFCVPTMLSAMRITGARCHDLPPTPSEILIPLLV